MPIVRFKNAPVLKPDGWITELLFAGQEENVGGHATRQALCAHNFWKETPTQAGRISQAGMALDLRTIQKAIAGVDSWPALAFRNVASARSIMK